jgi:CheY-like chemotaxis protein
MPLISIYVENDLMRDLLEEWLSQAGYRVRAMSPDRVPEVAGTALVIVSISSPKRAGAPFLRALRTAYPGTPFIALSAQFRSDLSTGGSIAQSLGVQQVMAKPLSRVALIDAVRAMIGAPC